MTRSTDKKGKRKKRKRRNESCSQTAREIYCVLPLCVISESLSNRPITGVR